MHVKIVLNASQFDPQEIMCFLETNRYKVLGFFIIDQCKACGADMFPKKLNIYTCGLNICQNDPFLLLVGIFLVYCTGMTLVNPHSN